MSQILLQVAWDESDVLVLPCLNEATVKQTDVDTFLAASAAAGFKGIEFRIEPLRSYSALNHSWGEVRQLLNKHGLQSVCLNSFEDFGNVPEDEFEAVLHRAREFSIVCKETNTKVFVACPSGTPKSFSKAKALEITSNRLDRIAAVAREYSINIAFEFVCGRSANTLDDSMTVLKAAKASNVGLLIDTFHHYVAQSTLVTLRDFPLERLWLVHFNDTEGAPIDTLTDEMRLLPGRGVIDLFGFSQWLRDRGWDGWLSVEMFRPEYWKMDPFELARQSMRSLKPYL